MLLLTEMPSRVFSKT